MIDILVFDKQIFVGALTVPEPPENELLTLYEDVPHITNGPLNVLYFKDLNYGIAITDKMVENIIDLLKSLV